MIVKFGSARASENGGVNGAKGDQKGGKEVSMQDFYMHPLGWVGMRPNSPSDANALAQAMRDACNNDNIGYGQADRNDVIEQLKSGKILKNISVPCNCDCSSLVRACIYEAMKTDVGQFNTANAVTVLMKSGKFTPFNVASEADCKTGDVLITKTKGHMVICVDGFARTDVENRPNQAVKTVKVQFDAPILKKGATGKFVALWQTICGANVDGSFGSETDAKTREFQRTNGLISDGSVGEKTWNTGFKTL